MSIVHRLLADGSCSCGWRPSAILHAGWNELGILQRLADEEPSRLQEIERDAIRKAIRAIEHLTTLRT